MRNLKKVIALVAVFAMLVSTVAFATAFSDVAATDNYAEAIETLNALGIITGDDEDGDGVMDFRPADTITRAEVTAIVARIQGMNNAAQTTTVFNDVPSTHWASGYVSQAANQGIVNGYGDGNFGPEDNVKYQEMVKMLMETLGYRPFANDNGGYPTGYIAAAQRYGVLDEVIGGAIDVEASRGMVAQMVYNALDTPLMDQVTYGADGQYSIYDGTSLLGFKTLLSRDLKMVKFTAKITDNSYSDGVDTSAAKTIKAQYFDTTANYNYLGGSMYQVVGNTQVLVAPQRLLQGDVDCDPYLGLAVEIYAKRLDPRDDYTVMAINSITNERNTAEFTLDQYEGFEVASGKAGYVKYLKNETDRNASKLGIQSNPTIMYNGKRYDNLRVADVFGNTALADPLPAGYNEALIQPGTNYSGKVTLLDTDTTNGYDVIDIEIGVGGVIDSVTNAGKLRFKNTLSVPQLNSGSGVDSDSDGDVDYYNYTVQADRLREIVLAEDRTEIYTMITKDGEAFDWAEFVEWDVVTVIWNPASEVYSVRVLGENNYVDGYIASVGDGKATLSDGNKYELAAAPYGISTLKVGAAGRFYVDEYGKIVALDKSVEIEGAGSGAAGNYAYILESAVTVDSWGKKAITVQVLAKDGEVYEADLASTIKLVNFDEAAYASLFTPNFAGKAASDNFSVKIDDIDADGKAAAFANILKNRFITYAANSAGEIKSIVVPGTGLTDELLQAGNAVHNNVAYDEETKTFKGAGIAINDNTVVFYITNNSNPGTVTFGAPTVLAVKEQCSVTTGAAVADNTGYPVVYAFDNDDNDEAQAVVILNTKGTFSPSTNVAVIDSKADTVVNGTDDVKVVSFYLNGEYVTATTDPDMGAAADTVIANADRGDIVKLTVVGDVITNAEAVMNFGAADIVGGKNAATIGVTYTAAVPVNSAVASTDDQEYFFGAITNFSNSGNVYYQPINASGVATGAESIIKEGDANVYVYDPVLKEARRLSVGSLGDANYDAMLADSTKTALVGASNTPVACPAYGMMDYIFARYYNNKPADIVIIKNYEFDYSI